MLKCVLPVIAATMAISASAFAGDFAKDFTACVDKYAANPKAPASVMMECNAANGKLSDCKILEAPTPAAGFDKAALCVAEILPIGSKTGTTKVPLKFNP